MLRLAVVKPYEIEVFRRFTVLALTMQDRAYEVRNTFIRKLAKAQRERGLVNPRFNAVYFLVAHDPDPENIDLAMSQVRLRLKGLPVGSGASGAAREGD